MYMRMTTALSRRKFGICLKLGQLQHARLSLFPRTFRLAISDERYRKSTRHRRPRGFFRGILTSKHIAHHRINHRIDIGCFERHRLVIVRLQQRIEQFRSTLVDVKFNTMVLHLLPQSLDELQVQEHVFDVFPRSEIHILLS